MDLFILSEYPFAPQDILIEFPTFLHFMAIEKNIPLSFYLIRQLFMVDIAGNQAGNHILCIFIFYFLF